MKVGEFRLDDCVYGIYNRNGKLKASLDEVCNTKKQSAFRFKYGFIPRYDWRPSEILRIPNFINHEGNKIPVVRIGETAFMNVDSRFALVCIPANVKVIAPTAFYLAHVKYVVFRKGSKLKRIGDRAFLHCDLERIIIPKSVRSIGECVFGRSLSSDRNLSEILFEEGSLLEEIGPGAFASSDIKSITIPPKVKTIPDGCFSECKKLEEVTILPDSEFTEFGYNAFYRCSNLHKITNLEKITRLGDQCFIGCSKFNPECSEEWQPDIEESTFKSCPFGERRFKDRIDQLTAARLARSNPDSTRP
jgi:hypothetical protein